MKSRIPLVANQTYHIYNRGINGQPIFIEERNYRYFMQLYARYMPSAVETYAYCLLRNHYHFLIRIKQERTLLPSSAGSEQRRSLASKQFATLFGTYTKAVNKAYGRSGPIFERPFCRKHVDEDHYFTHLVTYIHQNPQKHSIINDFRNWPYSSYRGVIGTGTTQLERDTVLTWFGDRSAFLDQHVRPADEHPIAALIDEDVA